MKTLLVGLVLVMACASICLGGGGVATSKQELFAVIKEVQQAIKDINSTSNRKERDRPVGVVVWCVCSSDRSKMLYLTDVPISLEQSGVVKAGFRSGAAKNPGCGGCYDEPVLEIFR